VVLSEDLDTTIDYDGIRVANPLTRSGLTDHLVGRSRQREAKG